MYQRVLHQKIKSLLFQGKIIVLYGARRVGKTTLSKNLLSQYTDKKTGYFNCEENLIQDILAENNSSRLLGFFGDYDFIVLDEAQTIPEIGKRLKLMHDTRPELQIIATGSSSFDLANQLDEPLIGRMFKFTLYPLAVEELKNTQNSFFVENNMENLMLYGSYPAVFSKSRKEALRELESIASNSLYKDILAFEQLKKPRLLNDLLKLLALEIGREVSYSCLSQRLNTSITTIEHYLDLLEKTFIIYRLGTLNRNLTKEISRGFKIYFTDLGVRNFLLNNFNPLNIRADVGALWENFCFIERKKLNENSEKRLNTYFWRTYDQKEIDYLEEENGVIKAYEFKWGDSKTPKLPKEFAEAYGDQGLEIIRRNNWFSFMLNN